MKYPLNYLVANNNRDSLQSYAEQYQVFANRGDAIEHYKSIGGKEIAELSDQPGNPSIYECGDVDVLFMPIYIQ